jgi:hypothetical protein
MSKLGIHWAAHSCHSSPEPQGLLSAFRLQTPAPDEMPTLVASGVSMVSRFLGNITSQQLGLKKVKTRASLSSLERKMLRKNEDHVLTSKSTAFRISLQYSLKSTLKVLQITFGIALQA